MTEQKPEETPAPIPETNLPAAAAMTEPTPDPLSVVDDAAPPEQEKKAGLAVRFILLQIAVLIIILDQFTKYLVETNLQMFEVYAPFPSIEPFFRIMHVYNTGAAFGIFPEGSLFFAIMAVLVSALILIYNFTMPGRHVGLRVALGLQMGGALGNFIDRVRIGHVTDFLDFGPWPLFNVADTAIVSGAVIIGILMVREAREAHEAEQAAKKMEANADPAFSGGEKADEWSA